MQFKEIFSYVNNNASKWLQKDKSGRGYICPICGSGDGPHGTGITEDPRKEGHFTCWSSHCFTEATYIDILAIQNGIDTSDAKAVADNACRILNLSYENNSFDSNFVRPVKKVQKPAEPETDYTDFFNECHKNISKTDYWEKRGLSKDILDRFNIGYCESWRHPKAPNAPMSSRLIIPTGKGSYLARETKGECDKQYSKQKVGKSNIFNLDVITYSKEPVFIVEGEIDAMSIMMAGAQAIGLGSLSNMDRFLEYAEIAGLNQPYILALDNDEGSSSAGNKVQASVKARKEELKSKGINIYFADVNRLYSGHKDANEALCAEYFDFAPMVDEAKSLAYQETERERNEAIEELRKESAGNCMDDFDRAVEESKTRSFIPTGFEDLNKILDGGLFPGLYIIGAISSLGKTTFCIQLADQIALLGIDVIIFSLEMSRNEIIAKSLSRLSVEESVRRIGGNNYGKSTRGILTGSKYESYSKGDLETIAKAKEIYKSYADHIFIYEAKEEITVQTIRKRVENHTKVTGKAPVVIIDYLQIIDPSKDQQYLTDKQVTDKNVKALKIISRDFNTTVIGISSFNRDNYAAPVNMASFKESGAIEYSSDVLIGLQYAEMEDFSSEGKDNKNKAQLMFNSISEKTKEGGHVPVQVKILKNRNGTKGTVTLDFCPMFNRFSKYLEAKDKTEFVKIK